MFNKRSIFLAVILSFFVFPPFALAQVIMNEFVPNSSQEWVEFYNSNSLTEDLSNYYFDDDTNFDSDSGSSQKISLSGLLSSLSTCYLDLNTVLNNNGDNPTLFKMDGSTVDTYSYTTTTSDKSYSRTPDGGDWQIDQTPTKSTVKCSDLAPTPSPTPEPTAAPTQNPTTAPTITPTKSPTPISTKSPTPKPTPTLTSTPEVLGEETTQPLELETANPTPLVADSDKQSLAGFAGKKKFPFIPILFIVTGLALVTLAAVQLVNAKKSVQKT